MKWTGMYLLGYVIFMAGLFAALWKMEILERLVTTWTVIGVLIAIGVGITAVLAVISVWIAARTFARANA